ncbi:hypothetical protein DLJ49_08170 [Rhodovulum sp. 12E13]|uniref:hypothetical protein n=1 Tax=Rhodovulum sp. 12E13 TaxID=2203891 RepID=UPI000E149183|nr:hypothetical protein [Rhodovulum sp. 12E13]RDC73080.1 hypothetical protein DLJ49_08170 [Rhodovulum sp. 12E13]
MIPGLHWLFRMKRWADRPPPPARVLLVVGVIVACLGLVAVERWVGWPDWMGVTPLPAPRSF